MQEIQESDFDLSLTGFDTHQIDELLTLDDEEKANAAPPLPESPVSRPGDLWLLGAHRVLCGDATNAEAVARLGEQILVPIRPGDGAVHHQPKRFDLRRRPLVAKNHRDLRDPELARSFQPEMPVYDLTVAADEAGDL